MRTTSAVRGPGEPSKPLLPWTAPTTISTTVVVRRGATPIIRVGAGRANPTQPNCLAAEHGQRAPDTGCQCFDRETAGQRQVADRARFTPVGSTAGGYVRARDNQTDGSSCLTSRTPTGSPAHRSPQTTSPGRAGRDGLARPRRLPVRRPGPVLPHRYHRPDRGSPTSLRRLPGPR